MSRFQFDETNVLAIGGEVYRFVGRTRDQLRTPRWKNIRTDAEMQLSDEAVGKSLERSVDDGGARLLSPDEAEEAQKTGVVPSGVPMLHLADITSIAERVRVERFADYCVAWREAGCPRLSDAKLLPIIERVANQRGERRGPHPRTLRRLIPRWRAGGLASLVSDAKNRGRKTTLSLTALQIVEDRIWDTYLTLRQPTVPMLVEAIKDTVLARNALLPEDVAPIPIPSKKQVEARIGKIDAFTRMALREGEAAALKKHGPKYAGVLTKRRNQRWEIDATEMDVFAIHPETGEVIGRPTLVVIIDCHTRMIMGWYIGFADESFVTATIALRRAIETKGWLKERFPSLVHDHPAGGMPECIVADNHMAYGGEAFKRACTAARIKLVYTPVLKAWWRGHVERFHRTAKERVFQRLPGGVQPIALLRKDKSLDPTKSAVATLDQIEEAFAKFVVDEYPYEIHHGLGTCPAHAWRRDEELHGLVPPMGKEALDTALAIIEERVLQAYGIEWGGMFFNSPLVAAAATAPGAPEKHRIAVNPRDVASIGLFVPSLGRWVRVPLRKPELENGKGMTYDEFCLARRLLRRQAERFIADNDYDRGFRRAHAHVQNLFRQPPSAKSIKMRKRGARWHVTDHPPTQRQRPDVYDEAASASSAGEELFAPGTSPSETGRLEDWGIAAAEDSTPPPVPVLDQEPTQGAAPDPRPPPPPPPANLPPEEVPARPTAIFERPDGSVDLDAAARALGLDRKDI